jgi:hypothetical protein
VSNSVDAFIGTYEGAGRWHDAAGESQGYRIRHANVLTEDGFSVIFHHDFDDGTVVDARFEMAWVAPHLFSVAIGGSVVGNGYLFESYCHYHLKVGEAFVEASYRLDPNGLEVFGSSTKNAAGNYIAWHERLGRTA